MKKLCKLLFYRFIALLLSCSMAFGEVVAMEHEATRRLESRVPHPMAGLDEDAQTDALTLSGTGVHESDVDVLTLRRIPREQEQLVYYSQAKPGSSGIYYSQAGSESGAGGTLYEIPADLSHSPESGNGGVPGQWWDPDLYAQGSPPSQRQGSGNGGVPGQWDPDLYDQGDEADDWDSDTYEGRGDSRTKGGVPRSIFSQSPPFGQGSGIGYYEEPDGLQPYRQDLMGAEHSKFRVAFVERAFPCSTYFFSTGRRVGQDSFPLTDEATLRRYHRTMGFFQGTVDAAVKGAYVVCAGLVVYQLVYGAPYSSVLRIFIGGDIRRLYNIVDFTGHQALGSVLTLPVINGLLSARSRGRLADSLTSPFEQDLALLKGAPSTFYNDFWASSIQNALRNLTRRLLYDGRLSQTEAFRILKEVYSFSGTHGGFSWLNAVSLFYAVANGPSRPYTTRLANLSQRAEALRYLDLTLRNSPDYSFAKFYMRSFLLGGLDLPEGKKGRSLKTSKTERVVGAFLRTLKLSGNLFILQGIVRVVIDLATPRQFSIPTEFPTPDASEINDSTPASNGTIVNTTRPSTVAPTVNGTATAATGAPTVAPTVNGTATIATSAPTNGTATVAPTLQPTLRPDQDSLLQYKCLQQLIRNWNKVPQESPYTDVLPRIARLLKLPSEVAIDLSRAGLSSTDIEGFFTEWGRIQPNVTIRAVILDDNILFTDFDFQRVVRALPLSLTTLTWALDKAQPNPNGHFNFTTLGRFKGLTALSLRGWTIDNLDSLTSAVPSFTGLQAINMSLTGLGSASLDQQTRPFISALFSLPGLQEVYLGGNEIGRNASDVDALARGVRTASSLVTLSVGVNKIGMDPISTLAFLQSLNQTMSMRNLDIGNNPIGAQSPPAGSSYALALAGSLEGGLSQLRRLSFIRTSITTSPDADLDRLATAVVRLPKLEQFFGTRPENNAPTLPSSSIQILRTSTRIQANRTDIFYLYSGQDVDDFFDQLLPGTDRLNFSGKLWLKAEVAQTLATRIRNLSNKTSIRTIDFSNNLLGAYVAPPSSLSLSQILAPAVGTLPNLEQCLLASNILTSSPDQDAWASVIGNSSQLQVLTLGVNYLGLDLSSLGAALNRTHQLTDLSFDYDIYLGLLGRAPLDVLGSTFSSLRDLRTLKLDHTLIFGPPNNGGSDLSTFFPQLGSLTSLQGLYINRNRLGSVDVMDGVRLAAALQNLRSLRVFDASFNSISNQGFQGADAITDSVLYLLSNGTLQDFSLGGGFNISAPYRAAHQAALRSITEPSLRDACGQELFNIITGTNSTSGEHRRSFESFEERDSQVFRLGQVDDERGYDDNGDSSFVRSIRDDGEHQEYATSGASHPMPPQPLVFIASCMRQIIAFFRGSPSLETLTWERVQYASLPGSVDDFSYVRAFNETDSLVRAEDPPAQESPLESVSNSTASVEREKPSPLEEKPASPFVDLKVIPSSTDTTRSSSLGKRVRTTLHFNSFGEYEARLREETPTRSYLHHGENMAVSTLFLFAVLQQIFDSSDRNMRDYYETYAPMDRTFRAIFRNLERDLKAAKQDAIIMEYSNVHRIYYTTTGDSAGAYKQELKKVSSDSRGVPTGRLKTLRKDLRRFEEDLRDMACFSYERLTDERRNQFLLECALFNLSEAVISLRDQEVVSDSRFKSLQRRLNEVESRLRQLKEASSENQGEMFETLREEMDWLADRLQEKIPLRQHNIRLPRYRDLKDSYAERARKWREAEDESPLPGFFVEVFE